MFLQGVKKTHEESDLERIQDLFPGDALRLYDKDVLTMRMKGLMRKRSTTAARLQRALSAKRPEPEEQTLPKDGQDKRVFLLETPVQFTTVSLHTGLLLLFFKCRLSFIGFVHNVFSARVLLIYAKLWVFGKGYLYLGNIYS